MRARRNVRATITNYIIFPANDRNSRERSKRRSAQAVTISHEANARETSISRCRAVKPVTIISYLINADILQPQHPSCMQPQIVRSRIGVCAHSTRAQATKPSPLHMPLYSHLIAASHKLSHTIQIGKRGFMLAWHSGSSWQNALLTSPALRKWLISKSYTFANAHNGLKRTVIYWVRNEVILERWIRTRAVGYSNEKGSKSQHGTRSLSSQMSCAHLYALQSNLIPWLVSWLVGRKRICSGKLNAPTSTCIVWVSVACLLWVFTTWSDPDALL